MRFAIACACFLLFSTAALAASDPDAGWLESGDLQLRLDLQLLGDAGVIRYPVSQWPIPRVAIREALAGGDGHLATNSAVMAALARVRAVLGDDSRALTLEARAAGGEASLLRDFGSFARESGELGGRVGLDRGRFAAGLNAAVVVDPDDGQEVRADGSHATLQWGNWLISANTLERWWGPGHQSSLILSNNARPMPTFMVERAVARPMSSPWLRWLGPWRFNFGISQMESGRQDVRSPLFMAWRVAIMPFKDIELGFSRTAQFCGDGMPCDLNTFGNLIAGNDNPGFDSTLEEEPGNQMAGFDMRWNSPLGSGPYAIYAQYIGEDESSYLPAKYLGQFGFEVWKPFAGGEVLQVHAEYGNTICSGLTGHGARYDCAYNQARFDIEGYRYRGRVIGHTTDADSESFEVGATYTASGGSLWSATARTAHLNKKNGTDIRDTVSAGPADYAAVELQWRGRWLGQGVSVEIGAESLQPEGGDREVEPFGFVGWRHSFSP